jgi:hypothetical protein
MRSAAASASVLPFLTPLRQREVTAADPASERRARTGDRKATWRIQVQALDSSRV